MKVRFFYTYRMIILSALSLPLNAFISDDIIDIFCNRGPLVAKLELSPDEIIAHGRSYYENLQKKGAYRHWSFPVSVNYFFSGNSFDDNGQVTDLSSLATGGPVTIADVSLFCRLCAQNKVRSVDEPALGFDRAGRPITGAAPFGAYRDDLVSTLIAPVVVDFNLDRQEIGCDITAIYRFWLFDDERYLVTSGLSVPFQSVSHQLNTQYIGGSLYREAFSVDRTQREDTSEQFFREYTSVEDCFVRGILGQKNVTFNPSNRNTGIGDLLLFSTIDCAGIFRRVQSLQGGVALLCPTGAQADPTIAFDPSLSAGCFSLDLFVNALFNSPIQAFNPFVRAAIEVSLNSYSPFGGIRAPTLIVQDQERVIVKTVPGLLTIDLTLQNFQNLWVDTFAEYDSTIPIFADTTSSISSWQGAQFVFGLGNYSYNVANTGARLELLYTYMYKQADSFSGDNGGLSAGTQQQAHTVSWCLAWPGKVFDLFVGSAHVFAGQNVARENRIFLSCAATF